MDAQDKRSKCVLIRNSTRQKIRPPPFRAPHRASQEFKSPRASKATALVANPLLEWCFEFIIAPSSAESLPISSAYAYVTGGGPDYDRPLKYRSPAATAVMASSLRTPYSSSIRVISITVRRRGVPKVWLRRVTNKTP
ncbi:MAG: hypothetical protein J3Q66DRAFT_363700 [Benniella sp.]|nr:MAG: hypothetical protein J3Q66DRAFT_363700 [Benniella sp.]